MANAGAGTVASQSSDNVQDNKKADRSSSPRPSPGSEDAKRGRSRTRAVPPPTPAVKGKNVDREGYHSLMSSFGKVFHVEKRWKLIREMGSGAYGFVISAVDDISGEPVAIKMVTRVFEKVALAKRALREITLLRHFSHENITGLIDVDISPNLDEIYIFMEPMEADLHQIVKSGQQLTGEHVQYFVYQILRGLKYIHSSSVVHRDLKPGNLLVNADCELKICDFGLARGFNSTPETPTMMTEYVATRWYRAPEIMLAFRGYNTAIDIWSVGCILAELILGRPLFKGKDYVDQLNKILDVLGTPDDAVIGKVGSEKAQAYIRSLPRKRALPFTKVLPTADAEAIDFLRQLIAFDPTARPTAITALTHPWLSSYHDEIDEPNCNRMFDRWQKLEELETLEQYKDALIKEIEDCRREVRSTHAKAEELLHERSPSIRTGSVIADVIAEETEDTPPPDSESTPPALTTADSAPPTTVTELPQEILPEKAGEEKPDIHEGSLHRKDGTDSTVMAQTFPEVFASPELTGTDPVIAYSRRSSFFAPSRQNSTYSIHRVGPPSESNTVSFPTSNAPEYVVPARTRTPSMYSVGGHAPMEERRKLLRTLSTVSVYESGEGHAGGLADIAPIGKFIVDRDKSEDLEPDSEIPEEIAEDESEADKRGRDGGGKKERKRFVI